MNPLIFNAFPDASEAVAIVKRASGFTRIRTCEDSICPDRACQRRFPENLWIAAALGRLAVVMLLLITQGMAADWPQWRGPGRNGTTPDIEWSHDWPGGEPRVAWKAEVGAGLSSVVVAEGAAYTLGNRGGSNTLWCFGAATGETRWRFDYGEALMDWQFEGGPCSTPLVAGQKVFAVGRSGAVHCLDAKTGRLLWLANLKALTGLKPGNWGVNGSPLLSGRRLVLNYGTAGIALDPETGAQLWLTGREENAYTSPVSARTQGREVLCVAANEALTTVDPVEGRILWNKKFHVGFKAGDPVLAPGGVFFSSVESGGVFVTLPETGEPKHVWSNRRLGTVTGTPVLVGGLFFGVCGGADGKGALTCFEPSTGKTLWSRPGFGWGSLLAAGDRLVVLSEKGEVSVVRANATEGEVLARFQALGGKCWSAPSLADGRLYIRNAKGSLVAFDLTTPRTAATASPRQLVSEQ